MPLLSPANGPRPAFSRIGSTLHCEDVNLADLAERLEGPAYVYSRRQIEENFAAWERGFSGHPHLVCYAVKAFSMWFMPPLYTSIMSKRITQSISRPE